MIPIYTKVPEVISMKGTLNVIESEEKFNEMIRNKEEVCELLATPIEEDGTTDIFVVDRGTHKCIVMNYDPSEYPLELAKALEIWRDLK